MTPKVFDAYIFSTDSMGEIHSWCPIKKTDLQYSRNADQQFAKQKCDEMSVLHPNRQNSF